MFSQKNRLRKKAEVENVVKHGRSVFDPICGIRFLQNKVGETRFAIVVGTKVHKGAVKRNRVRRQYREILRVNIEKIKKGYDVVLFTSQKTLDLTFAQKQDLLVHVLQKAGLWEK